jgi:hypothetical protein
MLYGVLRSMPCRVTAGVADGDIMKSIRLFAAAAFADAALTPPTIVT